MVYVVVIFVVVLAVMFLTVFLGTGKREYKTVSAGSASKMTDPQVRARNLHKLKYRYKNRNVSSEGRDFFVVDGDSMAKWGINDSDAVLVSRISHEKRDKIQGSPVLVFNIDRPGGNGNADHIEYKLRKFIGYISNFPELKEWLNKKSYSESMKSEVLKKYEDCVSKYEGENEVLVMSVTVLDNNEFGFSFHPLRFLYGEVQYIVNSNTVRSQPKLEMAYS